MYERPLLLFPQPENASRTKLNSVPGRYTKPLPFRQYTRLTPTFNSLTNAFVRKAMTVRNSSTGIDPEYALVFEVIGGVEEFYRAVNKVNGLEWMFDQTSDSIDPDIDFHDKDDDSKKLNGRVYCVMSNQTAMSELLSMWKRFSEGEENVFPRGTAPLKEVFSLLKSIRLWNAKDRIYETNVLKYWRESLEIEGNDEVPFEIEMFYRKDETKRSNAFTTISNAITSMGGQTLKECIISDIFYHSVLVSLPKNQIESLVSNYEDIFLVKIDDIMFFRPTCQTFYGNDDSNIIIEDNIEEDIDLIDEPVIAVFDGMPMQNHILLKDRIIIDDPDNYESFYQVKDRKHGTSMASLVIHGDLNKVEEPLIRKIYFRPIMKPYDGFRGKIERIPNDVLLVDLIHQVVKRMFEGNATQNATAPSIKIINFSIGDPYRQFATTMSPLARLMDWLSYKYKILFIISAGNQNIFEEKFVHAFSNFKSLTSEQRTKEVYKCLADNKSDIKVLSPGESINNITVGALYSDLCDISENNRQAYAIKNGYPSPISTYGYGYNKIITPDLFYHGGRKFLVENMRNNSVRWFNNVNEPGCKSAAPNVDGIQSGFSFTFGTSDATAQLTHESGKCYEILNDIFLSESGNAMPSDFASILIKAMLTHGASWDNLNTDLQIYFSEPQNKLARWIGNGVPNIARVQECTRNRVTLIGLGELRPDEAHVYKLPLPFNFSNDRIKRRLTVTLAYIAPTSQTRQKYRTSQIWFDIENSKNLVPVRQNTDWQNVRKGTLQHEIFTGTNAVVWDENGELSIKVNCKEDAERITSKVPYSIFVTFEVAEGLDLDIYSGVVTKIRPTISISSQ